MRKCGQKRQRGRANARRQHRTQDAGRKREEQRGRSDINVVFHSSLPSLKRPRSVRLHLQLGRSGWLHSTFEPTVMPVWPWASQPASQPIVLPGGLPCFSPMATLHLHLAARRSGVLSLWMGLACLIRAEWQMMQARHAALCKPSRNGCPGPVPAYPVLHCLYLDFPCTRPTHFDATTTIYRRCNCLPACLPVCLTR